jgi:hypothetical protein
MSQSRSEIDICGSYVVQSIEQGIFEKGLCDTRDRRVKLKVILKSLRLDEFSIKSLYDKVIIYYFTWLTLHFVKVISV